MASLSLLEKAPLSVVAVNAKGGPTGDAVTGAAFTSSDPTIAEITVDANGASWVVGHAAGTVTITATGKVGEIELTGTVSVEVTDAPAVALTVTVGAPVAQ